MFFKTNKPEVLNEFADFNTNKMALHASVNAFAKEFEGDGVIYGNASEIFFGGIIFKNNASVNRNVWTKPHRQHGTSNIRVKPLKKEYLDEWQAEKDKWDLLIKKHFPNGERVSKNGFYQSLWIDWGALLFAGFSCFEVDGFLYMDTSIQIKDAVEILGSEYKEAEKRFNQSEKDKKSKPATPDIPWAHRMKANGGYEIGYFGPNGFVKTDEAATLDQAKSIVDGHNAA